MSLVYTGNSRARKVTVTKYVNGIPQTPVTYPTNTDMANGSFTYSGGSMNIPAIDGDTPHAELSSLSESFYAAYLVALQAYAQEQQPGLNFATATVTPGYTAVIEDDPNCPEPGTPVVVPGTTTTTTTEEEVPGTTTTTTTEEGVLYWAFARCPGYDPDTCWMEDSVKTAYESSLGVFQSGDRFYGAVEYDPTYLYTFYSTSQVWYSTPSCVITGVSRTEDTCPV